MKNKNVIIETKNLCYSYETLDNNNFAIKDINLKIYENECVGVIGQSGSGKSTFFNLLSGLYIPSFGEANISGLSTKNKKEINNLWKKVGLIMQMPEHQIFETTVYKELSYGLLNLGINKIKIEEKINEICKKLDINNEELILNPFNMSGGQKKKIAFASVYIMEPRVLLIDEPTAGLDENTRNKILNMIKIAKKTTTTLIISHNLKDIFETCKRVIVFEKGSVVIDSKTENMVKLKNKLKNLNIEMPDIIKITKKLIKKGFKLKENIYTAESLVKLINHRDN